MTLFSISSRVSHSLSPPRLATGDRLPVVVASSTGDQMFAIYHWHVSCRRRSLQQRARHRRSQTRVQWKGNEDGGDSCPARTGEERGTTRAGSGPCLSKLAISASSCCRQSGSTQRLHERPNKDSHALRAQVSSQFAKVIRVRAVSESALKFVCPSFP